MQLIEKDSVLLIIEEIKVNKSIPKNYGTLLDIARLIRQLPTIDAEPVVRCKDCRFGTQSKQEPKDYFVRCIHNPFYPEHFHKNHYCGFGVKMDEEQ